MLTFAVSLQRLQPVSWWRSQILENLGIIDEEELGSGPVHEYRICFRWTPEGPQDVEIVDYH